MKENEFKRDRTADMIVRKEKKAQFNTDLNIEEMEELSKLLKEKNMTKADLLRYAIMFLKRGTIIQKFFRVELLDSYNEIKEFNTYSEALDNINKKLNEESNNINDVNKNYTFTLEEVIINERNEEKLNKILIMLSVKEYKEMTLEDKQKMGLKY